jgi:predicted transcriptional regulator
MQEPTMSTVRESLLEIAARLPDQCTWDEVMYQIYVRQKVEEGLADVSEGRTVDHEAVFEELAK